MSFESIFAGIGQLSLMQGWVPAAAQFVAAAALIRVIVDRPRRWRVV